MIIETCENAGCSHNATATLNAAENAVYGGEHNEATVTYSENWAGVTLTIAYSGTANDGTTYTGVPVNAGEATASIALGDVTASVNYTVAKATNEWTQAPSIKGWTYGEDYNDPTAIPKFGEMNPWSFSYRVKGEVAWTNNPPSDAGIYEMRARVQATDNWELLETTIEFEIKKASPTADLFDFTPPAKLDTCDGLAKEATVTVKEGVEGVGSVTVKYFKDGVELNGAPTAVGTYTVEITIVEGANYNSATLTAETWTFTFDIADGATHTNETLSPNGNGTHDRVCSACAKVIESDITCSGTTTDDCDKGYKCSCGGYFGTKEHNFSGDYLSDAEGHWHECADCSASDTKTAHTPENDDGSCLTEIKCSVCDYVTTEAKNDHAFDNSCDTTCGNPGCTHTREITHTPRNDDGDCTTAIHCSVCDAMTTQGNPSHDFDNACDTDCNRTECNHIRTITHTPNADDGDCTTAILCSICKTMTTEAKNEHAFDNSCDTTCGNPGCTHTREITHTPRNDDGDCTTAIHCAVCDAMTTQGNPSHDFDNACDTDCNRTVCNYTRTAPHTPEVDDGDCTTAVKCSVCQTVTIPANAAHIDINGDRICDECETYLGAFQKVSISLGEDIAVKYHIAKGSLTNPEIRFTINDYTKTVTGELVGEQYKFVFDGVAPQWIGDNIKAELLVNGEVIEIKNYSVLTYLNALKAKNANDLGYSEEKYNAMIALIDDLLIYGGAAQNYTGHNTDKLVSDGITGSEYQALTAPTGVGKKNGENIRFTSANVWFDSVNKLAFKFTATDLNSVTFKLKINDGTETVIEPSAIINNEDGTYTILSEAIKAVGFDDVYTLMVYNNSDNTAHAKIVYSVQYYVYTNQNGSDNMAALAKATYNYGLSAKAYGTAN